MKVSSRRVERLINPSTPIYPLMRPVKSGGAPSAKFFVGSYLLLLKSAELFLSRLVSRYSGGWLIPIGLEVRRRSIQELTGESMRKQNARNQTLDMRHGYKLIVTC